MLPAAASGQEIRVFLDPLDDEGSSLSTAVDCEWLSPGL
jgi:hypothetical protein